jgi:hypothetical protein
MANIAQSPAVTQQKAVVQRMIAIDQDLYLNSAQSNLDTEEKRTDWKTNIAALTGKTATDITPENFIRSNRIPDENRVKVTAAINNNRNVFKYYDASALRSTSRIDTEFEKTLYPLPKDILTEESDLGTTYDASKACVLQALVNAGVTSEHVTDSASPASWHAYYYNSQHIDYDDDIGAYQIYSGLGLTLVQNQPKLWSALTLGTGTYIFSSAGHNFCVVVSSSTNPEEKYTCHDEPQRKQLRYQADLEIKYIWKKP